MWVPEKLATYSWKGGPFKSRRKHSEEDESSKREREGVGGGGAVRRVKEVDK